ncbi:MAG: efflux RND transporter periplasmic adaptor subunit [Betaproteobacteria bacterium]
MNKKLTRRAVIPVVVVLALAAGYWAWSGRNATAVAKAPPPVPVVVALATTRDVPLLLEVVGRAEAFESVTLKSRVDGQVAAVLFKDGQRVRAGDILVRLDPNDFAARLKQAEANLARDAAQLAKTKADVERYVALKNRNFVSEEKVNEVRTNAAAAAATVRADQAALDLARLQVSYASLRAPFDGIVGARLVSPGAAVKVNDTTLAVINRVRPLYVTFAIPEKNLPRLRAAMSKGVVKVAVTVPGAAGQVFTGEAHFLDNAVDAATGTIQMKATLPNEEEKLTPGQFVNVGLVLETAKDAVVVPTEAVQQGPNGNFLFVVKPDDSVELRKIEVLASREGIAVIGKGVENGETVVTDGQLRILPGSKVLRSKPANPAPKPADAGR